MGASISSEEVAWRTQVRKNVDRLLDDMDWPQRRFAREMKKEFGGSDETYLAYFKTKQNRWFTAFAMFKTAKFLGVDIRCITEGLEPTEALITPFGRYHTAKTQVDYERLQASVKQQP